MGVHGLLGARRTFRLRMVICFFFNDTATTEIYTLSLHDALPISVIVPLIDGGRGEHGRWRQRAILPGCTGNSIVSQPDRKSTRLNSSHANISYAVFCLQKKKRTHSYRAGGCGARPRLARRSLQRP